MKEEPWRTWKRCTDSLVTGEAEMETSHFVPIKMTEIIEPDDLSYMGTLTCPRNVA